MATGNIHKNLVKFGRAVSEICDWTDEQKNIQDGPKNWHIFVRFNFIKYKPIFKIVSLSESAENLQ